MVQQAGASREHYRKRGIIVLVIEKDGLSVDYFVIFVIGYSRFVPGTIITVRTAVPGTWYAYILFGLYQYCVYYSMPISYQQTYRLSQPDRCLRSEKACYTSTSRKPTEASGKKRRGGERGSRYTRGLLSSLKAPTERQRCIVGASKVW